MRFKKGDMIIADKKHTRRIVEVKDNYYLWEYPDLPLGGINVFDSRNSNDPEFVWWDKVMEEKCQQ